MIPIHNNLLYSSGSLPSFSGGTQATFLFREGSSSPTIDLGINWTVVYNTYGGIEVEIEAHDLFTNNNLILGTPHNASYPYEFNYSTPYVEAGWAHFIFNAGGYEGKLEVSASQYSTDITAILDFYNLNASTRIAKSLKVVDSYGTIGESALNLNIIHPPVNLDGSHTLKIFFPGGLHANSPNVTFSYKKIKVYGYDGTNKTLIFEGVPWNDENGQACLRDLVSYKTFYSEIPNKLITE